MPGRCQYSPPFNVHKTPGREGPSYAGPVRRINNLETVKYYGPIGPPPLSNLSDWIRWSGWSGLSLIIKRPNRTWTKMVQQEIDIRDR